MRFIVPGIPKPQGRPRFRVITTKAGKSFAHTYDPASSRTWKETVASYAVSAGAKMMSLPIQLTVIIYLPRPKRLCRKKDAPGCVPCASRPDADNFLKAVQDALIGVCYADDALIYHVHLTKWYHEMGKMPRTEIELIELV